VAADSLTGQDISEPTLGEVTQANLARHLFSGAVHPTQFGAITLRLNTVGVAGGGTAENGNYNTGAVTVDCAQDEMALSGGAYWTTNGTALPSPDEELWIQAMRWLFNAQTQQPESLAVTGGNDTGNTRILHAEVFCLS